MSCLQSVVFPVPEGAEIIKRIPRRSIEDRGWPDTEAEGWLWGLNSFDVLDLFPNTFQLSLHLDHMTGNFRVIGF